MQLSKSVEFLSTATQLYEKLHLKKLARSSEIALFEAALLVVCCNNTSILHRFRDIATFTVYMTACNIKKSFIWATYTFQSVYEYILANRCYLFGALRFTKVSNTWSDFQRHLGHSYWCRLTDHIYGFQVPQKRIFVNNWSSRPDAIPVTSLKRTWSNNYDHGK